jgi:hypothetical protein
MIEKMLPELSFSWIIAFSLEKKFVSEDLSCPRFLARTRHMSMGFCEFRDGPSTT